MGLCLCFHCCSHPHKPIATIHASLPGTFLVQQSFRLVGWLHFCKLTWLIFSFSGFSNLPSGTPHISFPLLMLAYNATKSLCSVNTAQCLSSSDNSLYNCAPWAQATSSGSAPKPLPAGQSIVFSRICRWLGFPSQAHCMINPTHLALVAWCVERMFSLNTQCSMGNSSAKRRSTSIPATYEVAWTHSYVAKYLFFSQCVVGFWSLILQLQNTSGQHWVSPDVFYQRLQLRPRSLAGV